MRNKFMSVLVAVSALALASCGGGSSGSSGSGSGAVSGSAALSVAQSVSVVDAQDAASSNITRGSKAIKVDFGKAVSSLPSSAAYNTDITHSYVVERSAESFDRINNILCNLDQSKYADMMNQGAYIAQIDTTQCGQSKDDAKSAGQSSQNQSSGSNATSYENWTVVSERSTDQPHYVSVWMHEAASGEKDVAKLIMVKTTIYEGKSDSNPIGIFTANFKGCQETDTACATPLMTGYLKSEKDASGNVLLKFYVHGSMGFGDFVEQATLNKTGDSGAGSVNISDFDNSGGAKTAAFNLAYDPDYFYRANSDGTGATCLNRKNFSTNVWRYGLYYDENSATPGARVELANPGFPIKYTDGNGESYYGYAGYYGVNLNSPSGPIALTNGSTVYKQVFSASGPPTETPYTVLAAGGRLQKHVKKTVQLGDIKGIPLSYSVCDNTGCQEYRVSWDGTKFQRDATRSQSTNWMWQDLEGGAQDVVFGDNDYSMNFYSESLGGNGRIDLMSEAFGQKITLSNSTNVIFHKVSTVYPGETVPAVLACFENCIDPSIMTSNDPYFASSSFMSGFNDSKFSAINQGVAPNALVPLVNYVPYSFDTTNMVLKYGDTAVVLSSEAKQFGLWGGSMFDPTDSANQNALKCKWDQTKTCTWQIWDSPTFYTWETGANSWNQLTALKDANNAYVSFDPPMMVSYTRASTGAKYYLQYNGFGDMWGIPGQCVDFDTGLPVACFMENDTRHIRWVPEFSIDAGSTVTDAGSGSIYYVKPLDQEQQMKSTTEAFCTGAGLTLTSYSLPDSSLVTDPAIGTEPTVTNAPAVIGGVLQ